MLNNKKEKIMPIGATDLEPSISIKTNTIINTYFERNNTTNSLSKLDFVQEVKKAISCAKSWKTLKEKNTKNTTMSTINKLSNALEKLRLSLEQLDGHALSMLVEEINKEDGYFGFAYIEPFKQPTEYIQNVLTPFEEKVTSLKDRIAKAAPLKKQDWKEQLTINLVLLHEQITGNYPENIGGGGNLATPPDFYSFIVTLSIEELGEGLSERVIRDVIRSLKK